MRKSQRCMCGYTYAVAIAKTPEQKAQFSPSIEFWQIHNILWLFGEDTALSTVLLSKYYNIDIVVGIIKRIKIETKPGLSVMFSAVVNGSKCILSLFFMKVTAWAVQLNVEMEWCGSIFSLLAFCPHKEFILPLESLIDI